jgi:transposase InsO family protein
MIRYVDTYRNHFGVEQICRVLARTEGGFITSRGYRAAKNRPLSDRAVRDQVLGDDIERFHAANFGVYGVRKMHRLMKRQGWLVGRDQVARVMKTRGITGVKRGKTTFTTRTKPADSYPLDKVNRKFRATKPCQLWVADITYVATCSGFAYVAFVTDVFSRTIVGWSVSSSLKTDMLPLQALNMAAWNVSDDLTGLIHHSDRGSNYVSLTYTDRIVELGGTPSVGSKGDSYDCQSVSAWFRKNRVVLAGTV